MDILLVILMTPMVLLIALIFVGGKECFYCGDRLNQNERPIHINGKRSCKHCWLDHD